MEAVPLAEYLGPITSNLKPYHLENMVLAAHQTVALDANWKTVRDNFLEPENFTNRWSISLKSFSRRLRGNSHPPIPELQHTAVQARRLSLTPLLIWRCGCGFASCE